MVCRHINPVMASKKTTLLLDATVAKHLKVYACKNDRSMSDITQEALNQYFALSCPKWKKDYIILEDETSQ